MITVCKEEGVFATVDGEAIEGATLSWSVGALGFATFDFGDKGAMAGGAFGCGANGAIRETDGGAEGAKRRVNGSRRRKGAGREIGGATTEFGCAGARFGWAGEKL